MVIALLPVPAPPPEFPPIVSPQGELSKTIALTTASQPTLRPAGHAQPQFSGSRPTPSPLLAQTILPNPDGTSTLVTPDGNRLDITGGQLSGDGTNLFHSFQEFGLTPEQVANFITSPAVQNILSGVNGGNPSIINGLLQVSGSNANLYLINPAGILFGPNAALNLQGSFTAATADQVGFGDAWWDILNPHEYEALTGTPDQFAFTSAEPGAILNLGNLAVEAGQSLSLLGGTVLNLGTLVAPAGTVTLMAVPGENLLRISQDNMLLSLEITPTVTEGGQLRLNPLSLPELLTGSTTGADLTVVQLPDGTVRLESASAAAPVELGSVIAAGTIATAGDRGGQIYLLGERIATLGADITATGNAGGGTIRIGGDLQGQGELPTASTTLVDRDSQLQADSVVEGDGGSIGIWADDATSFLGNASVQGAGTIGNGGLVEISGARSLLFSGLVNAFAPSGNFGTLLLDPQNIEVGFSGITNLDSLDSLEGDVTVDVSALNNATVAEIILQATANITFSADINNDFGASLQAIAGNHIILNSNISLEGGNLTLTADRNRDGIGSVSATPNTLIATQGGAVEISGATLQLGNIETFSNGGSGQVTLESAGNIEFESIDTSITVIGTAAVNAGNVTILANGTVRGTGAVAAAPNTTIRTEGTGADGAVSIQHDGGPNNAPFVVGNAAVNGTAGAIAADMIVTDESFEVLENGGSTRPTNPALSNNITITSINTPPTLTATPQLSTPENAPLSFTVAELNLAIADRNADNTTLIVTSIPAGRLLRNGVVLSVGEAIAPTDNLQYVPPTDATGQITAFSVQARDGVSASDAVPIAITLTPPLDPTLGTTEPPELPQPLADEAIVLRGVPLAQSALLEELSLLGLVLPEPSWLIVEATLVNPEADENQGNGQGAIFPDLGFTAAVDPDLATPEDTPPPEPQLPQPPPIPEPSLQPSEPVNPSEPDISPPQETPPGSPVDPDPDPDLAAAPPPDAETPGTASPSSVNQGLKNCQAQAQAIQTKAAGDRTQPVYAALIACYEGNLATAIEQDEPQWVAYSLNNLAAAAFVVGDYLKSLELHEQQLEQAIALNDPTQEGIALGGIGAAYAALGDYATAIDYYERSLATLPIATAPQWKALAFRNLGNAYFAEQDYVQAAEYQRASLDIAHAIGDQYGEMQAQGNLGGTLAIQGDFAGAIAAYQQALELATLLHNDLEIAQTLLGLSTVHAYQQNYEQAYRYSRDSLAIARQLGASLGEGIALTNLGNALLYLNRLPEAEQVLYEAIAVWESLRAGLGTNDNFKVSLFETQLAAYRNLQEVLITQNKIAPALEISERGRARAFVELLARGNADPQPAGAVSPPNLAQMQQVARTRNVTLVEYAIIRDQATDAPHAVSVQNPLVPRDAQLYIWVVQPSGAVQFRQVNLRETLAAESVADLVTATRNALTDRAATTVVTDNRGGIAVTPHARDLRPGDLVRREGDLPDTAPYEVVAVAPDGQTVTVTHPEFVLPNPVLPIEQVERVERDRPSPTYPLQPLHELLIAPIQDWLPTDPTQPVVFVPQEHLFLVPFAALQDDQGRYFIEQHTPLLAPSIQTLALVEDPSLTPPPTEALIVGNPSPLPGGYAPLPNAAIEAQTIANLLATSPLIGSTATESQVKSQLAHADLIHLATHGRFDEAQPLQGAIALAPDAQNDGFLTAAEILDLPLQAHVVILSACDTGRGRITGDGVIGLSRSFMAAGVPRVVVSLWQVPDDTTAELMVAFHQQRLQTNDTAQALRQAMLTQLEINPDPATWAAFVQIGR